MSTLPSRAESYPAKGRVAYVDIAKQIAIMAVIYDHLQYYVTDLQLSNAYIISRGFIFSFYLQIFFVTVGIVDGEKCVTADSWIPFLKKCFISILVPYIAWAAILSSEWNWNLIKGVLWGTQTSLAQTTTDSVLWFLPVLFGAKVIYRLCMQIMYRIAGKESKLFLVVCALSLGACGSLLSNNGSNTIIWALDIAMMSAALIVIGRLLKPILEWIHQGYWNRKLAVAGVGLVLSVALAYADVTYYTDEQGLYGFKVAVWMAHGFFGANWLLFLVSSTVSCVFILTVAMLLEKITVLAYLGRNTLGFMLIHGKMFGLTLRITTSVLCNASMAVVALAAVITNVILCMPAIWFANRFAPGILGRTPKSATAR